MRAGKLRHMIDVEAKTGAVSDGFGNSRPVYTAVHANIPADITSSVAAETWVGETIESQGTFIIKTRFLPDCNDAMRIRFNGRTFEVISIINKDERNISLQFQCKEVMPLPNVITTKTLVGRAAII